jgi:deazaflavin-dependent oxidoreductase (nitroreductase family)
MKTNPPSLFFRLFLKVEEIILTRLVPLDKPGPIFKWLFKAPILHYKLGLGWMVGKFFLLLTATGRKSGKPRQTPLEYRYNPASDTYFIMAGWGGKTDWFHNVTANPTVGVQVGRRRFTSRAERVSDEEVAEVLAQTIRINPGSKLLWSRWAGEDVDGSPEGLLRAAKHFPSFRLKPLEEPK